MCLTDPGYDVDVVIRSDLASLYEVWPACLPIPQLQRQGRLTFEGQRALTRRMPAVLHLSPLAGLVAAGAND